MGSIADELLGRLGYATLDRFANQLARLLVRRGPMIGSRIGIRLEYSPQRHVAMLAALKAGAAYVPMDQPLSMDRLTFVARAAELSYVITSGGLVRRTQVPCAVLDLDEAASRIDDQLDAPLHIPVDRSALAALHFTYGPDDVLETRGFTHARIIRSVRAGAAVIGGAQPALPGTATSETTAALGTAPVPSTAADTEAADTDPADTTPAAAGTVDTTPADTEAAAGPDAGPAVRWREGERLQHLFEDRCDWLRDNGLADRLAVDAGEDVLTFGELDRRANQFARHLLARGVRPGDRVALMFDQALYSYVAMLGVLKAGAAYVPLDPDFPAERVSFILRDASVHTVLSLSRLAGRLQPVTGPLGARVICLDEVAAEVAGADAHRLTDAEKGRPADELCYIVYTSGSTGQPKGVAIEHASICNFVRVAVEVYGIEPADRVYQGMTTAFDFSVEEIWVPLVAGATLVPKPAGGSLLGEDLREYLVDNRVTALCCVPTLLATIEEDLPDLRFLLVSGEACPQDLVARWHRPGRRFLNVYGPTEATVTATWTQVHPGKPVTLGVPLPTYSIVILDPDGDRTLPDGELGEIGIAGVGLARGYVNRPELTGRVFIPDFLNIAGNPSRRIYRSGDLGRINGDGEIEYHGRIDTQVKIRGYRIELTEIESVLLQAPGVAQAVVTTFEPEPGVVELAAYYSRRTDTASIDPEDLYARLREHLPSYMMPAYLDELAVIPMLPSDKADRKSLPAPAARALAVQQDFTPPASDTERALSEILAEVLRIDRVSVDSHFFAGLGANSLLMAHFCARVRKRPGLPTVSMKDLYLHPTVRDLAQHLGEESAGPPPAPQPEAPPALPGRARYVLTGVAQLVLFLCSAYASAAVLVSSIRWIAAAPGFLGIYERALAVGAGTFAAFSVLPILAKWLLVGRWKSQEIPVWGWAYLRFWLVKLLIRSSPLARLRGSPLYVLYLRALGAKIGKGVVILSPNVPVCTDLLTVGDGTIIRKTVSFTGYRAHRGVIETGPVTIGRDAYVGEATVLDINTVMGDGAQLGHASSLHSGQSVPDGESWHGSPGEPANSSYNLVEPARCGTARRVLYSCGQLLTRLVLTGPLRFAIVAALLAKVPWLAQLVGPEQRSLTDRTFYVQVLVISLVLFSGAVLAGLALITTVPRLFNRALRPGKVYPLFGIRFWVQDTISRRTNSRFFTFLFGDSSYIVGFLRAIGYNLPAVEQTGSNFGMAVRHETPFLSSVGSGTMVSDGLSFLNADFSSTSFTTTPVTIGANNFLGNNIVYPAQGRTGGNCLLATKVMIPIDGEVREGVGLLGSPPFEIPRSVARDSSFDEFKTGEEFRRRLRAKNRHNLVTMAMYLFVRWFYAFVSLTIALVAVDLVHDFGVLPIAVMSVTMFFFTAVYFIAVDRAVTALGKLQPRFCSIYDRDFWRHERFWKVPAMTYVAVFNGTPFKGLIWRLLGVRAGKRVFDDGCWMTERTLVTIGDGCTLNAGATIQSHSLEDGTFKSDHITIGDGVTLGINAFVHYGVTMGAGAVLEPDAFLMKGEDVPPHARWRGNPATQATAAPRSRPALAAAPAAAPQEPAETAPPVRVRLAKAPVAKARPRRRRRRPHRSARL